MASFDGAFPFVIGGFALLVLVVLLLKRLETSGNNPCCPAALPTPTALPMVSVGGIPLQEREVDFLKQSPPLARPPKDASLASSAAWGGATPEAALMFARSDLEWCAPSGSAVMQPQLDADGHPAMNGRTDFQWKPGEGDHSGVHESLSDDWSFQTTEPMRGGSGEPDHRVGFLYYEVAVSRMERGLFLAAPARRNSFTHEEQPHSTRYEAVKIDSVVAIGWATSTMAPFRLPGDGLYSLALHSDGLLYRSDDTSCRVAVKAAESGGSDRQHSVSQDSDAAVDLEAGTSTLGGPAIPAVRERLCDPFGAGDVVGAGYSIVQQGNPLVPGSVELAASTTTVFFFTLNGERLPHVRGLEVTHKRARAAQAKSDPDGTIKTPLVSRTGVSGVDLLGLGAAHPCVGAFGDVSATAVLAGPFTWANAGRKRRRSIGGNRVVLPPVSQSTTITPTDNSGVEIDYAVPRGRRRSFGAPRPRRISSPATLAAAAAAAHAMDGAALDLEIADSPVHSMASTPKRRGPVSGRRGSVSGRRGSVSGRRGSTGGERRPPASARRGSVSQRERRRSASGRRGSASQRQDSASAARRGSSSERRGSKSGARSRRVSSPADLLAAAKMAAQLHKGEEAAGNGQSAEARPPSRQRRGRAGRRHSAADVEDMMNDPLAAAALAAALHDANTGGSSAASSGGDDEQRKPRARSRSRSVGGASPLAAARGEGRPSTSHGRGRRGSASPAHSRRRSGSTAGDFSGDATAASAAAASLLGSSASPKRTRRGSSSERRNSVGERAGSRPGSASSGQRRGRRFA